MRFGTSFFNLTLFKKNVTRYWPIWAGYLLFWLLILPVTLLVEMRDGIQGIRGLLGGYFCTAAEYTPLLAFFFGAVCAMAVLSHLYSSRSANFFGALPVRREGIFFTQYLSGLAFTFVPNLLVAGLSALECAAFGLPSIGGAILTWLGVACGNMFFFYTFAFFCGMFVGHILALPAFYLILNLLSDFLYSLATQFMREAYYGFAGFSRASTRFFAWLTPVMRLNDVEWAHDTATGAVKAMAAGNGWNVILVYCAAAVVFLAASFFLYRSRRLESAGDVVAVRCMRPVFKYGAAICVGLTFGYFTPSILGEATLPYAVVIWTVIGCFLAQMILDKSFRVFKKWRGAAVTGALMAAVMACVAMDVTGFETWLPDARDVESVTLHSIYSYGIDVSDGGDLFDLTVTEPAVIEDILAIHKEAIDRGDAPRRVAGDGTSYINFDVSYMTRTGEHRREYYFTIDNADFDRPGTAASALEDIYRNRDVMWRAYGFDKLEEHLASGGRIDKLTYCSDFSPAAYDADYYLEHGILYSPVYPLEISNYANVLEIYEAVKQDFQEGKIGVHISESPNEIAEPGNVMLVFDVYDAVATEEESSRGINLYNEVNLSDDGLSVEITVSSTAERTLEALSRIVPEEIESQKLDVNSYR